MTNHEAFTQGLVFGIVLGTLLLAGIIALAENVYEFVREDRLHNMCKQITGNPEAKFNLRGNREEFVCLIPRPQSTQKEYALSGYFDETGG